MVRSTASLATGAQIPSLACYGRTPDADLTYRHLVSNGAATVGAMVRDLGMDRRRVITALDELATIGAAEPRPSPEPGAVAWSAKAPADVLSSLRPPRRSTSLSRSGADVHRCGITGMATAEPLALGDELRYLPSRAATRARLADLVAVARHEHLAMHPEADFDAESLQAAAPMDRKLLARGVRMQVLGVQPRTANPLEHRSASTGTQLTYRLAPELPAKLLVIDRKIALFPVAPENLERGYLEVAQAPVVAALVSLFERHWFQATEPQECAVPQIVLTLRERALLSLLAQGHTDATAARELRVSPRSVSNMLRSLMDRLEVDNRFQLGLALGAMHAIPTPARPVSSNEEPQ